MIPPRLLILFLVLAQPALSGVIVRSERPLTEVMFGPPAERQSAPAVATDGTDFAVVWGDERWHHTSTVRVGRVTAEGNLLDPVGIAIPDRRMQGYPVIFWTGANYTILTVDLHQIWAIRFSREGRFLDDSARLLFESSFSAPLVSASRERLAVTWYSAQGPLVNIYRHDFVPVIQNLRLPVATQTELGRPSIGGADRGFLVTWSGLTDSWRLYGMRLSDDGSLLDEAPKPLADLRRREIFSRIGSNGADYLVTWPDPTIKAVKVAGEGAIEARTEVVSLLTDGIGNFVWTGSSYLLPMWVTFPTPGTPDDLFLAHLSDRGELIHTSDVSRSRNAQKEASAAFNGQKVLIVWSDGQHNDWGHLPDLTAAFFDSQGRLTGPHFLITVGVARQKTPAIAFDGENFLAAWSETRGERTRIKAGRISQSGLPLDGAGFELAEPSEGLSQILPAVTFNGLDYVVFWVESGSNLQFPSSTLRAIRVSRGGRVLDQGSLFISDGLSVFSSGAGQHIFEVASGNSETLVVFEKVTEQTTAYVAGVTADGLVLSPRGVPLTSSANATRTPSIAFNASHFLAVWEEALPLPGQPCQILCPPNEDNNIMGARLLRPGVSLDSGPIAIANSVRKEMRPYVSSGRGLFLVAWVELGIDPGRVPMQRIMGRRVDSEGSLLDGSPTESGLVLEDRRPISISSLSYDGLDFVLLWGDGSTATYLSRISPSGVRKDASSPVLLGPSYLEMDNARLLGLGNGHSIFVYDRPVFQPEFGTSRVFSGTIVQAESPRVRAIRR